MRSLQAATLIDGSALNQVLSIEWSRPTGVNSAVFGLVEIEVSSKRYVGGPLRVERAAQTVSIGRMDVPSDLTELLRFLGPSVSSYPSGA